MNWRVIITDTESLTGVAPVCETDHTPHSEDGDALKDWVFDCCPHPQIECWDERVARDVAFVLSKTEANLAGA